MLYIVPTPIGNLKDMTYRSIEVMKDSDLILAEDTRTSGKLLKHYGIETPMKAYHQHNEHQQIAYIIDLLRKGQDLVLVSDAGTPGISDPGFLLARTCRAEGVEITCLPGATAFVPAIVASGLSCDKFFFEGFLPHKKGRQTRWKFLSQLPVSFVLYESPHRVLKCLEEIITYCGSERKVCVAREISKFYEEYTTDTATNVLQHYHDKQRIKGEIVIIIEKEEIIKPKKSNKYR